MSTPVDIDALLRREGENVEWKENVADIDDVIRKLAAFANDYTGMAGGGWVVCGVREEKDEHGFPRAVRVGLASSRLKEVKGKVLSACRDHVSPPLIPHVEEHEVPADPSRRILLFYVPASPHAHAVDTREGGAKYWVLSDSNTVEAKGELQRELLRRKEDEPPLLERPCPGATMDDINRTAAEEFLKEARLPRPPAEYLRPGVTIDAIARPLVVSQTTAPGVVTPIPTYLALLLFGREPTRFLPGAHAVFSVYEGESKAVSHSVRVETAGPLPKLIRDVLEKLTLYMGTDIDKSADALAIRQNRPRYSMKAVQEAVVNAFAHRDYGSSEPTRVTVLSDRIEILNPGGIGPTEDPERLREGRAPVRWRNPALASFLLRMQLAQNEGQGIPTILKETLEVSGHKPEIRPERDTFEVVVPAFRATPAPRRMTAKSPGAGVEALLLISIGGESIRPSVEASLVDLGLEGAEVLVDFVVSGYVEPDERHWEVEAKKIRNEVKVWVEDPRVLRFHLFYRGPVVVAPLLGALVAPAKALLVYHYQDGRYRPAYTLDRRFLVGRD